MQTTLKVLSDKSVRYMNYDLNEIYKTADSIYLTLVPEEVFVILNVPYLARFSSYAQWLFICTKTKNNALQNE